MIGLIGKKVGMTQYFDDRGHAVPVTVIQAGPCTIVQRKTIENDGYAAVQLGFEIMKEKKANKAQIGHFKKHNTELFRYLKEFRIEKEDEVKEGEKIDVTIFQQHELIKVTGTSKGRGFAGVMKRHGFHGFMASHGVHESFRGGGSIGQCATPARVVKGKKMPGHYGNVRVSTKNLQIVKVDTDNNLLLVKGAVPGHRNSLVVLNKEI